MNSNEAALNVSDEAKKQLERARAFFEKNDWENTSRECEIVVQLDPKNTEALNLRRLIRGGLRRKEEAFGAYRAITNLGPSLEAAQEGSISSLEETSSVAAVGKKFNIRAVAYVIDLIVLFLSGLAAGVLGGIFLVILQLLSGQPFRNLDRQTLSWMNLLAGIFISVLYFATFEWLYGASLGKIILHMRVVQVNGAPCTFRAALIRDLLRFIDGLFLAIPAYLNMKHPLYQRIRDKAANTLVVSSSSPKIRTHRSWWWFFIAASLYLTLAIFIQIIAVVIALR